jgi:uncharacterized membrane protein YbhN (UPF0104 family)
MGVVRYLDRRAVIAGAAALVVLAGLAASTRVLGGELGAALADLAAASPEWLWLAAGAFGASLAASACAWRAGLRSCGASLGVVDAASRYSVGSLVNSAAPGGCGGAVRILLFSRTLPGADRLWTAGGVAAAVSAARALALAPLVLAAAALAGVGVRPALALAGVAVVAVGAAVVARRSTPHRRVAHVLDVFRALGRAPREAATLAGWVTVAVLARLAAAACVAAALAVGSPLRAAAIAVTALALANIVPLTPGNVGVGSGAVAIALHAAGTDVSTAIALGIALHALETVVNVLIGAASVLYLTRMPAPAWLVRVAGAAGCLAVAGSLGATVLV